MIGFAFEIKCDLICINSTNLVTSEWIPFTDLVGTKSATVADAYSTTTTISKVHPTIANFTYDTNANTATYVYLGQTPANMQSMGLPARGDVGYYRCWGGINYLTTKGFKSATAVIFSALTPGENVTMTNELILTVSTSGAYQAIGGAILAISALNLLY